MRVQIRLVLLALALSHIRAISSAPPPPAATTLPPALSPAATEFVEAHNEARAEVRVEPLKWSQQLATSADRLARLQRDRNDCRFANLIGSRFGGNQLWVSGQTVKPRAAVEAWVKEKAFYDHASNTCQSGHTCGVYTQVVWRKSTELGCAQTTCRKEKEITILTLCFYDPPGNVVGQSPY